MFHHKDYIYCIYEKGSFSKAAEVLHISQPSLSAVVNKIETKLGTQIFNRKTKPVTLTPFGVEYIYAIEQIYEIEERLHVLSYEIHTLQSGRLSIGSSSLDNPYFIPRLIAHFKKLYPNIQLQLYDTTTVKSKQLLDEGKLDFFITNQPMDATKYEKQFCYYENLVWVVPQTFSINNNLQQYCLRPQDLGERIFSIPDGQSVPARKLAGVPVVLLNNDNYLRSCTDMIFQGSQLDPAIALEVESPSIAYNFARLGVGATVMSSRLLEHLPPEAGLSFYKVLSPYGRRSAYAYYSKGHYVTAAMRQFLVFLESSAAEISGCTEAAPCQPL